MIIIGWASLKTPHKETVPLQPAAVEIAVLSLFLHARHTRIIIDVNLLFLTVQLTAPAR